MTSAQQDSRQRIQAAKPGSPSGILAEKPIPPWELPGSFRLDCEPHRANMLFWPAIVGVILLILSPPMYGLPLFIAFPLALATCVLARRDLALMHMGQMDRRGEKRTRNARDLSQAVIWICAGASVLALSCLLAAWIAWP